MLWVFDINETMLDLAPLDAVFAEAGLSGRRTDWFDLLIHAALVTTATGQYRDFGQLGGATIQTIAGRNGVTLADDVPQRLGAAMRSLPAHREVPGALSALRDRGQRVVALGNSPAAVIDAQLEGAGLRPLLDGVYSVELAGMLKPGPAPYRHVLESEGVDATGAVMVAAHDWDIAGAQAVGMRTAFVARGGRRPLPGWPEPDIVAPDLLSATRTDP
jgi:2-haloacid dehalogenase